MFNHSYLSPHGMYFHEREYIFQTMFNFFPADLLASIDIPRCPFPTRATLLSFLPLFSDRLVSSLQIRRRPVRFLPLTPVYLYAFMPIHAFFLSCEGVLYRLHFFQRFSNCSAATVDLSHLHVGIIYVTCNSPGELFHACRHAYTLHLFRVCVTS